jgi:hypothetical protein
MDKSYQTALADMQGKLFERSGEKGYNSESFIHAFMTSRIAAGLDSEFDYMQWAGKEYILEKLEDEYGDVLKTGGDIFNRETLYWAGYVYRKWHFYTGESSKEIYKQAGPKTINSSYFAYHCMDVEMAIERLRARQRKLKR